MKHRVVKWNNIFFIPFFHPSSVSGSNDRTNIAMLFHLPLGLLYVVKDQHLYRQFFFTWQLSSNRESLVLSACTNGCPICTGGCLGFFLIILLELSHVTLMSKFSHLSLMAFFKFHLSAIESRFKTSRVLNKTFIRTAQNIWGLLLLFEQCS